MVFFTFSDVSVLYNEIQLYVSIYFWKNNDEYGDVLLINISDKI